MSPAQLTKAANILTVVKGYFRRTLGDLESHCRRWELLWPRHLSMLLLRRHAKLSLPEIGCIMNRHHTGVLAAIRSCENRLATNADARADLANLESKLGLAAAPAEEIAA
jgi:chromosomal replication initiation ATPase DnaA